MYRFSDLLSAIMRRLIVIGFSVQIILGIIWIINNFNSVMPYGNLAAYVAAGRSDMMHRFQILYGLQLMGLLFSCGFLFRKFTGNEAGTLASLWGGAAIMTCPIVLQVALSISGYAVYGMILILLFAVYSANIWNKFKHKHSTGKKNALLVLNVIIISSCLLTIYLGNGPYNVSQRLFGRIAYTTILQNSARWPEKLREVASDEEILYASMYAEKVEELSDKLIENGDLCREIGLEAFGGYKAQIIKEYVQDFIGYVFPQGGTGYFLSKKGYSSFSIRNYDLFKRENPYFSSVYMIYGLVWQLLALLMTVVVIVLQLLSEAESKRKAKRVCGLFARIMAVIIIGAAWQAFTFSSTWDYRKAVGTSVIWGVFAVSAVVMKQSRREEQLNDN